MRQSKESKDQDEENQAMRRKRKLWRRVLARRVDKF